MTIKHLQSQIMQYGKDATAGKHINSSVNTIYKETLTHTRFKHCIVCKYLLCRHTINYVLSYINVSQAGSNSNYIKYGYFNPQQFLIFSKNEHIFVY